MENNTENKSATAEIKDACTKVVDFVKNDAAPVLKESAQEFGVYAKESLAPAAKSVGHDFADCAKQITKNVKNLFTKDK